MCADIKATAPSRGPAELGAGLGPAMIRNPAIWRLGLIAHTINADADRGHSRCPKLAGPQANSAWASCQPVSISSCPAGSRRSNQGRPALDRKAGDGIVRAHITNTQNSALLLHDQCASSTPGHYFPSPNRSSAITMAAVSKQSFTADPGCTRPMRIAIWRAALRRGRTSVGARKTTTQDTTDATAVRGCHLVAATSRARKVTIRATNFLPNIVIASISQQCVCIAPKSGLHWQLRREKTSRQVVVRCQSIH